MDGTDHVCQAAAQPGQLVAAERAGQFVLQLTQDATGRITSEQAMVVPAGSERQFRTAGDEPAQAVVCMRSGGVASVPGQDGVRPIPWAE